MIAKATRPLCNNITCKRDSDTFDQSLSHSTQLKYSLSPTDIHSLHFCSTIGL
jgi:hypothetical protein